MTAIDTTPPDTSANSTEAIAAELAKPEDASAYIEQRREDDAPPAEPDETDQLVKELRQKHGLEEKDTKKASRYERLKRARDSYKAEAEELRAKYERSDTQPMPGDKIPEPAKRDAGEIENSLKFAHDKHGDKFEAAYQAFMEHVQTTGDTASYNKVMSAPDVGDALVEWFDQGPPAAPLDPYQEALEQGRQQTNFEAAIAEREAQIRLETEVKFRAEQFAQNFPDFYDVLQGIDGVEIPPQMQQMIARSEFGPALAYYLAKDAYEGEGLIWSLQSLEGNPIAQAQLVGRMEQAVRNGFHQASSSPRKATKAPPANSTREGWGLRPEGSHLARPEERGRL